MVLPEVADSFFALAINGIESVAREKGYHVIVYLTHEDQLKERSILREFRSGRVDGVLISVSGGKNSNDHIRDLGVKKVPMVFFDRVCEDIDCHKVLTNDLESGYNATEHLIKKGCKRVAFLSASENLAIVNHRLNGYKKALAHYKYNINKQYIISCANDEHSSFSSVKKLLTMKNRPDGIIGSVEKLSLLAYTICADLKLSIPNDVKVIGFSSLDIARLLNPALTTITQPAFEMGKAAATLLFRELEGKHSELRKKTITLPSMLIERASTQ